MIFWLIIIVRRCYIFIYIKYNIYRTYLAFYYDQYVRIDDVHNIGWSRNL